MSRERAAETDLGRVVVRWLEADGWDVWQEVGVGTSGRTCDIVAKRGPVIHAIECKVVANLDVLEQAETWVYRANFVSVAVPRPRRNHLYSRLARCLGIGVVWVADSWRNYGVRGLAVDSWEQGAMARPREHHFSRPLAEYLTPERKAWPAEAGNNASERYTPFRESCEYLRRVVEAEPGITVRIAVERMKAHHYHSDKAARGALAQWVRAGKVPGVMYQPGDRAMTLHPIEAGRQQ